MMIHEITEKVGRHKRKKRVGGSTEETEDRRRTIYAQKPSYCTLANIDGLTVEALRVLIPDDIFAQHHRSALSLHNATEATISNVQRRPPGAGSEVPVVMMEDCRDVLLTMCLVPRQTSIFLGLAGPRTANISLRGNDLRGAGQAVHRSDDVPAGAVAD